MSPEWVFRKSLPQDDPQAYCPPVLSALLWLLRSRSQAGSVVGGWVGGSVLQDLLPCLSGQGAPAKSRLQLHPQGRPLSSWSLAFPGDLPGSPTGGQGVSAHPSEPAQLCSSEHALLALGSSRIPCTRCSSRKVLPRHCSSSTTSWHVHSLQ